MVWRNARDITGVVWTGEESSNVSQNVPGPGRISDPATRPHLSTDDLSTCTPWDTLGHLGTPWDFRVEWEECGVCSLVGAVRVVCVWCGVVRGV